MNSCRLQNCKHKKKRGKKMSRIKKRIVAMMMVSALSVWFALPNVAYAKTFKTEGINIDTSFTANSSSATATISYSGGSGQVVASVTGYAHYTDRPSIMLQHPQYNSSSNPTPGGASASISAPSECSFFTVFASWSYEVYVNDTTYKDTISDRWDA